MLNHICLCMQFTTTLSQLSLTYTEEGGLCEHHCQVLKEMDYKTFEENEACEEEGTIILH